MKIHLRSIGGGYNVPVRATAGSFGYDLSTNAYWSVPPHGRDLLPTGLALAAPLPDGVAMTLWPRSSLFWKKGVLIGNSIGLIDQDYTGEIKILVYNTMEQYVGFEPGERLAQLVFLPVVFPEIVMAEDVIAEMGERGGFGSTG